MYVVRYKLPEQYSEHIKNILEDRPFYSLKFLAFTIYSSKKILMLYFSLQKS